jgi:5-methylcytosine-specific restriction endonuclease McrA
MQVSARYCSTRCGEIARGQRLPESLPERVCELPECGKPFQPYKTSQRTCCERHGQVLWNRESRADGRQKPEPWTEERKQRWKRRQEAMKAASTGRPVVRQDIGDRDGWVCYLCEQPIDRSRVWPDPESATTDHVTPLSKGGEHDPDNVRITHARCNSAKGNRLPGQLLTS